jgi:hypothetical protein
MLRKAKTVLNAEDGRQLLLMRRSELIAALSSVPPRSPVAQIAWPMTTTQPLFTTSSCRQRRIGLRSTSCGLLTPLSR